MSSERLLNALGKVDEELIIEAAPENAPKKAKKYSWIKWGALAACACLVVGIGAIAISGGGVGGALTGADDAKPEEPGLEGNITADEAPSDGGFAGGEYVTMECMAEIMVRVDKVLPDGFRATVEVGNDVFKNDNQVTVVAQDNVTLVQQDGSIFDYNDLVPNIKDSDLTVGSKVWVGFQSYDYLQDSAYSQIFAYHISYALDGKEEYTVKNEGEPLDVTE